MYYQIINSIYYLDGNTLWVYDPMRNKFVHSIFHSIAAVERSFYAKAYSISEKRAMLLGVVK